MDEFDGVLQETPGRTDLTEHSIYTSDTRPVRLPPYRIPRAHRDAVLFVHHPTGFHVHIGMQSCSSTTLQDSIHT